MEHFKELFDRSDEDLGVLLALRYVEKNDPLDKEYLPVDEKYWELSIHARDVSEPLDEGGEYRFDLEIDLGDASTENVTEVVYPHFVERFEEEYGESLDRLLYMDPEDLTG